MNAVSLTELKVNALAPDSAEFGPCNFTQFTVKLANSLANTICPYEFAGGSFDHVPKLHAHAVLQSLIVKVISSSANEQIFTLRLGDYAKYKVSAWSTYGWPNALFGHLRTWFIQLGWFHVLMWTYCAVDVHRDDVVVVVVIPTWKHYSLVRWPDSGSVARPYVRDVVHLRALKAHFTVCFGGQKVVRGRIPLLCGLAAALPFFALQCAV